VSPSGLLDYIADDTLQLAEPYRIPTILLCANWDNLSSKGILYRTPTIVGVWGEQTKKHAMEVQGFPSEQVRIIDSPHLEAFRSIQSEDIKALRAHLHVPETGRLILFAGCVRTFDETEILAEIEKFIDSRELPPSHVIFRPHPRRATRRDELSFFDRQWNHVTMDHKLVRSYQAQKKWNEFL